MSLTLFRLEDNLRIHQDYCSDCFNRVNRHIVSIVIIVIIVNIVNIVNIVKIVNIVRTVNTVTITSKFLSWYLIQPKFWAGLFRIIPAQVSGWIN